MTPDGAKLTFVVPCKGRLEHLRESLPTLVGQDASRVVVVESSCPDGAGAWVSRTFPSVQVVSIDDGGAFNLSRCRNAGLKAADTPWICFIDADVLVSATFARDLIPRLAQGAYYRFPNPAGRSDLTGTCVVAREDAMAIEGYDEAYEAWGGRDRDFYMRLGLAGRTMAKLPGSMIQQILPHSDELRTAFYARKDMRLSQAISAMYRLAKFNIIKQCGPTYLTLADRRDLFARAEATVGEALARETHIAEMTLELPIAAPFQPALGTLRQTFTLEIDTSRTTDHGGGVG